jgi:hypothetical protein
MTSKNNGNDQRDQRRTAAGVDLACPRALSQSPVPAFCFCHYT